MADDSSVGIARRDRVRAASERRSSYRLHVDPGAVVLDLPGSPATPVVDLSGDGGSLLIPRQSALPGASVPSTLHLGDGRSLGAHLEMVRQSPVDADRLAVGVRFKGLSPDAWRSLAQYVTGAVLRRQRSLSRLLVADAPLLRLTDRARIADLLRLHGLHRARHLGVYRDGTPLRTRLRLADVAPQGAHLAAVSDGDDALEEAVTYSFLLPGLGAALLFSGTVVRGAKNGVTLSFPTEVLEAGFRGSGRLRTVENDRVVASFPIRRGGERRVSTRVHDVSDHGLSFPLRVERDLLFPGDRIEDVRVRLPTGTVTASAIVRSIAPRDRGLLCGIEILHFERAADRERWARFFFTRAHPRTRTEGGDLPWLAWQILDSSQFLEQWTRVEDRERLEHQFRLQWEGPAARSGRLIVLRDGTRTVGTLASSRILPRMWLLHSLGVDRNERRHRRVLLDAARELFAAILWLLKRESRGCYYVLFAEKGKRWNELLYDGFVRALPPGAPSIYDGYDLFKFRSEGLPVRPSTGPADLRTERAGAAALQAVARGLRALVTPLESDAYSYGEEEISLGSVAERGAGQFRREIAVVRAGGEPVAAVIADSGSEGVSVFGLLNSCRVFFLRSVDDPARAKAICSALLSAAWEWYHRLGVAEFIFYATSDAERAAAGEMGGRFVSGGVRWLASCDLLPAWMNYVDEVLRARWHEAQDDDKR
jgi:hypothetical protein